uniref:AMP-binding enzyme n=1 Tax=Nocardia neocaledoniensis TaxID=236511 RepID=UPI003D78DF2C
VIGVPDELKGHLPLAYVVLKQGVEVDPEQLREELAERVRAQIGAIATLHSAIIVTGLPKTRSGKILRKTIRQLTAGEHVEVPATIEDPAVLTALADRILANPPLGASAPPGQEAGERDGDPVAPTP